MVEAIFYAYVPDLPGCIVTGSSVLEVENEMREANQFHIDGMREDGYDIAEPSSIVEYMEITV